MLEKIWDFFSGSVVKSLPANAGDLKEVWVQSLGQEDPLKEEIATHSSILTWGSHGQRNLTAAVHGITKESDMT